MHRNVEDHSSWPMYKSSFFTRPLIHYTGPVLQGSSLQVEILYICPFICPSVINSYSFPYSDSKLTQPPPVDLSHATSPKVSNVPHPCLPCPPVNWSPFPVNWTPMNRTISFPLGPLHNIISFGVELCVNWTFF